MNNSWFQRYILPGLIFQSAIIAGAYGSGQELAEFFLPFGPLGGLLGMLVTMAVFSIVLAVSFEFSRRFKVYDYRSFFRKLLGPGWVLYEILYVAMMLLIISVIGAAAGRIMVDTWALPELVGTLGIMVMIAALVFYGTPAIERFLALWSFVLYGAYIIFFTLNLAQHGGAMVENLGAIEAKDGWAFSGIRYAGYNLAMVPVLIFCIRHLRKSREAITAGLLAGPLAMIPAMLFFVAMIGQYDALIAAGDSQLPVTLLLASLEGAGIFVYLFPIVLFGTFIETGAALIHGVNERIDNVYAERGGSMPQKMRPAVAVAVLFGAIVVADAVGLTSLVGKGYGYITYGFLAVFVVPILTWGVVLIRREKPLS